MHRLRKKSVTEYDNNITDKLVSGDKERIKSCKYYTYIVDRTY